MEYVTSMNDGPGTALMSLLAGSPGPETLKNCKDILMKATQHLLGDDMDTTPTFVYGPDQGDEEFRQHLATFLTDQYGDQVDSNNLMVTAGATQAFHMISTILFSSNHVMFVEDPTYFNTFQMMKQDFSMKVVPVPCDQDGMDTEALDRLLTDHRGSGVHQVTATKPFWAMVYTIPVFNNPTGRCYSPERCRRLVELARKHNVLVLAEDVYNLIYYQDSPPARLLSYDRPSDPDYQGNVLSSGTFSKILAPGLRVGWVEGPQRLVRLLHTSYLIQSGGSPNHYATRLVSVALKLGLETEHLKFIRHVYKERRDAVCKILREHLPEGSTFTEPQGGFFVWVEFPEKTDTLELLKYTADKHNLIFLPGVSTSVEGRFGNCARVSLSYHSKDVLVTAFKDLCHAAACFIQQQSA